jgi:hypothetical protein
MNSTKVRESERREERRQDVDAVKFNARRVTVNVLKMAEIVVLNVYVWTAAM